MKKLYTLKLDFEQLVTLQLMAQEAKMYMLDEQLKAVKETPVDVKTLNLYKKLLNDSEPLMERIDNLYLKALYIDSSDNN